MPSAQTHRATLPVTSTAPAAAAAGLPSLRDEPKPESVKEQKPAAPLAPETPAKVITVPALKPRQPGDEAAVSDSKQVRKATRAGADASGDGSSKRKD